MLTELIACGALLWLACLVAGVTAMVTCPHVCACSQACSIIEIESFTHIGKMSAVGTNHEVGLPAPRAGQAGPESPYVRAEVELTAGGDDGSRWNFK